MSDATVEDGFGSEWVKCQHPLCDLHVCRPGKAQCNEWCDFVDAMGSPEASSEHVAKLLDHIDWLNEYTRQMEEAGDE